VSYLTLREKIQKRSGDNVADNMMLAMRKLTDHFAAENGMAPLYGLEIYILKNKFEVRYVRIGKKVNISVYTEEERLEEALRAAMDPKVFSLSNMAKQGESLEISAIPDRGFNSYTFSTLVVESKGLRIATPIERGMDIVQMGKLKDKIERMLK